MVIAPMPQLVLNNAPPPATPFTTNEIQMQAAGLTAPIPTSQPQNLPPHVPLVPPIPPPSLLNKVQFQNIAAALQTLQSTSPQHSQPPAPLMSIPPPLPMMPQSIPPPSPINVDTIPPPPSPPQLRHFSDIPEPVGKKRRKRAGVISSCAPPPPGFCEEIPLPESIPLPEQGNAHFWFTIINTI